MRRSDRLAAHDRSGAAPAPPAGRRRQVPLVLVVPVERVDPGNSVRICSRNRLLIGHRAVRARTSRTRTAAGERSAARAVHHDPRARQREVDGREAKSEMDPVLGVASSPIGEVPAAHGAAGSPLYGSSRDRCSVTSAIRSHCSRPAAVFNLRARRGTARHRATGPSSAGDRFGRRPQERASPPSRRTTTSSAAASRRSSGHATA